MITGFVPEEWIARIFHDTQIAKFARNVWPSTLDYRVVIVFIGVAIIAWDVMRRGRAQGPIDPANRLVGTNQGVAGGPSSAFQPGNGTIDAKVKSHRSELGIDGAPEARATTSLPDDSSSSPSAAPEPELALPRKPSIAVLPFANMSGDAEQEFFADGMAEDLTTALSKVRWFFVVSRNSAFTYKGKQVEVKQAARELGVRYVLEGSVRKSGDRVRITAQLIDAPSGHHVWAERYDRDIADIFAVQDEIAEQVVAAIEPKLYAAEGMRAKRKPPGSLDAWECVVRALSLMNSRAKVDVAAARKLLEEAIALDPGYAQAHSLFAIVICVSMLHGWLPMADIPTLASNAAHKALLLDVNEPWAHVALGYVLILSKRPADTIVECEKTLALNPNFAMAHYLEALASCYLGNGEEALAYADKAARLGPRDLLSQGNAGLFNSVRANAYFVSGRYRDGIDFARKALLESPGLIPARRYLVINYALAGDIEDAQAALQTLKTIMPEISLKWINETILYVRDEDRRRYVEAFRLAGLE